MSRNCLKICNDWIRKFIGNFWQKIANVEPMLMSVQVLKREAEILEGKDVVKYVNNNNNNNNNNEFIYTGWYISVETVLQSSPVMESN